MRILLVAQYFPPDYVGGAEIASFYSAYGLLRQGHDVTVLVLNHRSPTTGQRFYEFMGVKVREFRLHRVRRNRLLDIFDWRLYHRLVGEFRHLRPDIVHVHNVSGMSLAAFPAARRVGVPVVLTLHDHWLLCPNNMLLLADATPCDPAIGRPWCRDCYHRYDFWGQLPGRRRILASLVGDVKLFISPSHKLVELHARAGYDPGRFRVLRYGMEPTLFASPPSPEVQRLCQEYRDFNTLLFAGSITENKGPHILARALPLLERLIPDFRLLVAGAGEGHFEALLRGAPSARLLGKLPFYELAAVYSAAKLTVVPSIWYDNSPVVIMESIFAGTPVLGARIGGIPEMVRDGETGLTFEAGNPVDLAMKASDFFSKPQSERIRMQRECSRYAHAHLSSGVHTEGLLAIYREALAR